MGKARRNDLIKREKTRRKLVIERKCAKSPIWRSSLTQILRIGELEAKVECQRRKEEGEPL